MTHTELVPPYRRRAIGVAVVAAIALAAAGGFLAIVLAVAHDGRGGAAGTPPGGGPTEPATASATATTTSTTVTASPPGGLSRSPEVHLISGDMCQFVTFAPAGLLGGAGGTPVGDHTDKSDYTVHTCDQRFSREQATLDANASALVFADTARAAGQYADSAAHPPDGSSPAAITGLGEEAFAYLTGTGSVRTVQLWCRDGNLVLGVRLRLSAPNQPDSALLRAAATEIARAALTKL